MHSRCVLLAAQKRVQLTLILGECEICKEERDASEEMTKIDDCDMEKFGTLDSSEKTVAILGD